MKNTFGQSVTVTLFGESHGSGIGAVIDGLASGICVSENAIEKSLARRRPSSSIDTPRREADSFEILSGVYNGKTTGTPISIIIKNENVRSGDYNYGVARPSHADYTAFMKYGGFEDFRGGGHFSGRVTAALAAVGGILIPALSDIGVGIGTHILECHGVRDRDFCDIESDVDLLAERSFPTLDENAEAEMVKKILTARENSDSIGGITQTVITGVPAGLGEPWFDSVEGVLAHALFSLGGIKGVDFGLGFGFANMTGGECNDAFRVDENGRIYTETNNNGGINGGITNGMPVLFRCAVKPTPSISKKQKTIDFVSNKNSEIEIKGRHDPAIIRRICPVIDSVVAIVLCDMLAQRFGTNVLKKGGQRCFTD